MVYLRRNVFNISSWKKKKNCVIIFKKTLLSRSSLVPLINTQSSCKIVHGCVEWRPISCGCKLWRVVFLLLYYMIKNVSDALLTLCRTLIAQALHRLNCAVGAQCKLKLLRWNEFYNLPNPISSQIPLDNCFIYLSFRVWVPLFSSRRKAYNTAESRSYAQRPVPFTTRHGTRR